MQSVKKKEVLVLKKTTKAQKAIEKYTEAWDFKIN